MWSNELVLEDSWTIPARAMIFFIACRPRSKVSACAYRGPWWVKRFNERRNSVIGIFPGTLLVSFFPLLLGASIGPEGPLGFLLQGISGWLAKRLKMPKDPRSGSRWPLKGMDQPDAGTKLNYQLFEKTEYLIIEPDRSERFDETIMSCSNSLDDIEER